MGEEYMPSNERVSSKLRSDATPDDEVTLQTLAHREAVRAFRDAIGVCDYNLIKDHIGLLRLGKAIASAVKAHDRTYIKALKATKALRQSGREE
jgi:hypothetical protein